MSDNFEFPADTDILRNPRTTEWLNRVKIRA